MEQNENIENNGYENFEDKWKDESLLKILEEKALHHSTASWFFFYGAITVIVFGFVFPWLFIEESWRFQMMFSSVMIAVGLYMLSLACARRAYIFCENKVTKNLRFLHRAFPVFFVVIGGFFLEVAYVLWIFTGFAPYPQEPFFIWLLG